MTAQAGLLLVDKPAGITSHDVVARVRRLAGTRRVGHAGTLDPMATGLLVLGIEAGTKLLTYVVGADKTYQATIRLGWATVSDDRESAPINQPDAPATIALARRADLAQLIDEAIAEFRGHIEQRPSRVSAIKVAGQRSYDLVRKGADAELPARPVTVQRFERVSEPVFGEVAPGEVAPSEVAPGEGEAGDVALADQALAPTPYIDFDVEVDCSSGTYIRALARDLGARLGVGAHLIQLRRTRIGEHSVEQAMALPEPGSAGPAGLAGAGQAGAELPVIGMAAAARALFAELELADQGVIDLRHGKRIAAPRETTALAAPSPAGVPVAAFDSAGELIALVEPVPGTAQLRSTVVFAGGGA